MAYFLKAGKGANFLELRYGEVRILGILGRWDEKADPHTQYPVGLQLLDGL
jgi:hypothetical protein